MVDDGSTDETRRHLLEAAAQYRLASCPCHDRTLHRVEATASRQPSRRGSPRREANSSHFSMPTFRTILLICPAMVRLLEEQNADFVQGDRSANRRDNVVRRASSWVGPLLSATDPCRHHSRHRVLVARDETRDRRTTATGIQGDAPFHPGDRTTAGLHRDRDFGATPTSGGG